MYLIERWQDCQLKWLDNKFLYGVQLNYLVNHNSKPAINITGAKIHG